MSDSSLACPACSYANSTAQLWCENCDGPLPLVHPPAKLPNSDPSVADRAKLYDRVLTDLDALLNDRQVSQQTYDAIRSFYTHQLASFDAQAIDRRRVLLLKQLVADGWRAAHQGNLEHAISLFQRGLEENRGEYLINHAITEIAQRQDALRAEQVELAERQAKKNQDQQRRLQETREPIVLATLVPTAESTLVAEEANVDGLAGNSDAPVEATLPGSISVATFVDDAEELPSPIQRLVEATSQWSTIVKPFLLDNVGWFVGAFMVVAGFVVLIVTFWSNIEQNRILMHSLVYFSLAIATGAFFSTAYFMRSKYPQLESSSNVLLTIVALLIPLVFAAAMLTSLIPGVDPAPVLLFSSV